MRIESKHRQVVALLGRDIVDGILPVGTPIDPQGLETTLDVSRSVVREAVRVLEDKGLVQARPNRGTRVQPAAEWNLLDPDVARWIADSPYYPELKIQAKEVTEALLMLAPAFGDNPYLTRFLAALEQPESEAA